MVPKPVLYGPDGRPIDRRALATEIAGPTLTGVRSPLTGYPGDGLDPRRLATIMREADAGDPLRFLELAETIEERDMHYVGVLGTRRRAVAQLDVFVEAASDSADDVRRADMVREWLKREELQDEIFDMLDAVSKGYSVTEILWETSEGQYRPRLEYRDPRWFRPSRHDLATPLLIDEHGQEQELPPFKFVVARIKAKSGLPIRAGVARAAAWGYMFKKFAERDWAVFTQTYGQPIRVGKYGPGATPADKDTLFRAVANIAGDCAAIVPDSMAIEFIESKNVGPGSDLYEKRADWIDRQISKLVLGQTTTTDAVSGGHAVSREHRKVQEDIERADARTLSAVLNRDLVRPWVDLEDGPQRAYPRLRIGRDDERDIEQLVEGVERLVPLGLKVGKSWMNDQLGIPDPGPDEELLVPTRVPRDHVGALLDPPQRSARQAMQSEARAPLRRARTDALDDLAAVAEDLAAPAVDSMIDTVRALVMRASSLDEIRDELLRLAPQMPAAELASSLRLALVFAELAGRDEIASGAL